MGKGGRPRTTFALGVEGSEASQTLSRPDREPGHCPASKSGAARPQEGAPGCYRLSSFSTLTHSVALGRSLILWATGLPGYLGRGLTG